MQQEEQCCDETPDDENELERPQKDTNGKRRHQLAQQLLLLVRIRFLSLRLWSGMTNSEVH